jgi:hypothetical protein
VTSQVFTLVVAIALESPDIGSGPAKLSARTELMMVAAAPGGTFTV